MQVRCVEIRGAHGGHNDTIPENFIIARGPMAGKGESVMTNVKSWIDELDQVSEERQLSRYDQLLLDAAEVQLLLGNLGAADNLINKISDYNIIGTFNVLKEKED